MDLAEGIKVLPLAANWESHTDLRINSGVEVIDPGRYEQDLSNTRGNYRSGVYRPKDDWRQPATSELGRLLGITSGNDLHNTVLIVDAPMALRDDFRKFNLARMFVSPREHELGKRDAFPFLVTDACEWLTETIFLPFDLRSAEINVARPGRFSSTYDLDQNRERGLHVDNWGLPRRKPVDRTAAGLRVCINLGDEDRQAVFINLDLRSISRFCRRATTTDLLDRALEEENATPLVERFMNSYSDYPVVSVRLRPGQAYIAPVQNVPHDGYPVGKAEPDVNLQLSSNRFRFTEGWSSHCKDRAKALGAPTATGAAECSTGASNQSLLDTMGPLRLLIIQPTPFCNINCEYCYLPNRNVQGRMSLETVDKIFSRVLESGLIEDAFTIVWHAGEPLVMGVDFYERVCDLADKAFRGRCGVTHSLQTNGILVSDKWCLFIRRRGVRIGLSIDGPDFIHNARRKTRSGRGTHATVMKAVALLQAYEIPFTVIAVVGASALPFPEEFVDFFVNNGIYDVGFNIEEIEGSNRQSSLCGRETEFRSFVERLYKRSRLYPQLRVREFETTERFLLQSVGVRSSQATPFQQLSVDVDGNYSTFSPELLGHLSSYYSDFVIGNVYTTPIDVAARGVVFRRIYDDVKTGIEMCRKRCVYFSICGGGAPSNKYFENRTFASDETLDCRLTKQCLSEVVLDELQRGFARS